MLNIFNVFIEEVNCCFLLIGSCLCLWKWILDVDFNRILNVIYKVEKFLGVECEIDFEKECRSESK